MNKTKTTLAAVGGVSLVAVLAAGFFAWSAFSAKTAAQEGNDEGIEGLDSVLGKAERLMAKPIRPSEESVRQLTDACGTVKSWKDDAFALASAGDRRIQPTTEAAFKEFVVGDARRLQALPAGAEKKTLDPAFDFGPFKPYIAEGKMPDRASIRELQRKWDDVATLLEVLSESGVESVTAIELKTASAPKEEEQSSKKAKKKQGKKSAVPAAALPAANTYVISCRMRPASLVKAVNALAKDSRFTVVSDFSLRREKDTLAEVLGAEKKDDVAASSSGGRRRRRGATAVEKKGPSETADETPRGTVVTDRVEDAQFEPRLTVEVYDFQTAAAVEEKKEGEDAQ